MWIRDSSRHKKDVWRYLKNEKSYQRSLIVLKFLTQNDQILDTTSERRKENEKTVRVDTAIVYNVTASKRILFCDKSKRSKKTELAEIKSKPTETPSE